MSHGHPGFRAAPRDQLRARCAPRGTVAGMKIKPGGVRRLDRVLAADYLAGLERRPLGDVRSLRCEAEQEETDLSYTRRREPWADDRRCCRCPRYDGAAPLAGCR